MLHFTDWNKNQIVINKIYNTPNDYSYYWNNKLIQDYDELDNTIGLFGQCFREDMPNRNENIELLSMIIKNGKYAAEVLKEYIFEEERMNHFYDKPSRKRCLYCFDDQENSEEIRELFHLSYNFRPVLVKIEPIINKSKVIKCDASLLDCNLQKVSEIRNYAKKYWEGQQTDKAKIEYLLEGEFLISEILN